MLFKAHFGKTYGRQACWQREGIWKHASLLSVFSQQSCTRKGHELLFCPHGPNPLRFSEHWDEGQGGLSVLMAQGEDGAFSHPSLLGTHRRYLKAGDPVQGQWIAPPTPWRGTTHFILKQKANLSLPLLQRLGMEVWNQVSLTQLPTYSHILVKPDSIFLHFVLLKIAQRMWLLSIVEMVTQYNTGHRFHCFVAD